MNSFAQNRRRVVITAAGVITPLGASPEQIVENIASGRTAFEHSDLVPGVMVSPVRDFDLKKYTGRFKDARYLNRGAGFAVAAALEAVRNAGTDMPENTGLFAGAGPYLDIPSEFPDIINGQTDWNRISALWILRFLPNTAASVIARLTGIHGEHITTGDACAASATAIGEAFRKVRDGYMDTALAGGGDSRLGAGSIMAYKKAQALYSGDAAPEAACRPFDQKRAGFVSGEGGAFFLLEELGHAQRRGAEILAEMLGYGASVDGWNMTAPEPEGRRAEQAVRNALKDAGLMPGDIAVVSAHGTGTLLNDAAETAMLARIFDTGSPKITAFKSWIGHVSAGCGAVELALCLACMKHGILPKIRNLEQPCYENLNFTRKTAVWPKGPVLLENFGFGGKNSALVFRSWNGS